MRVPYSWLVEYVKTDDTPDELARRLTLGGIQVEEVVPAGPELRGVVAGRILEVKPHPTADKLVICRVDVGTRKVLVATGAPNVEAGRLVPVALPGAVLPGGKAIEAASFRGVISEGMLCSEPELGLGGSGEGIMILPGDVMPGSDIAEVLGFTDSVLVLELTANRSDCQGIVNVAREVAALSGATFELPSVGVLEEGRPAEELARVEVWEPALCRRYTARVFENVKVAESPLWLQNRLRAAGVRPINNVVDVTNYVMLEFNQPLHAFDRDWLVGRKIIVRGADDGETMVTLDGVERRLPVGALVIADEGRAVGVAGVMGGENSEVTPGTRRILLESAYFDPVSVRRTAKALGLRTEASNRFERGIDPDAVGAASDRAARLLVEMGAVTVARGRIDTAPATSSRRTIALEPSWVNRWLGTEIPSAEMVELLTRLDGVKAEEKRTPLDAGAGEEADAGDLVVEVPSYRRDLEEPVDLAEEIARLYGYDRIEETLPGRSAVGGLTPEQGLAEAARRILAARGFQEIVTNSLTAPDEPERLGLGSLTHRQVALLAPLSEEQAVLRTNLLGSMLRAVAHNLNRRNDELQLFEVGRAFLASEDGDGLPTEKVLLSLGLVGTAEPEHFSRRARPFDFYDLKGTVASLLAALGIPAAEVAWRADSSHPVFHSGQCARVAAEASGAAKGATAERQGEGEGEATLGFVGQGHPAVLREYGIEQPVWLAELDFAAIRRLALAHDTRYSELPRFPVMTRDVAVVVPESVTAAEVENEIRRLAARPELVEGVGVFDVYSGEPIPSGFKNLAFHIVFRSLERTLRDAEADIVMTRIKEGLEIGLGGRIRQ